MSRALVLVNNARAAMGLDRVSAFEGGRPKDTKLCPVAQLLDGVYVCDGFIETRNERKARSIARAWRKRVEKTGATFQVDLPQVLRIFIEGVDAVDYL